MTRRTPDHRGADCEADPLALLVPLRAVRQAFDERIEFGVFGTSDSAKDDMRRTVTAILDDVWVTAVRPQSEPREDDPA